MASTLCLLSDDQVDKVASFDITNSLDLHDSRFGNAGSTEVVCPTCGMRGEVCMGHHASLSLGLSMFHPLMYKESQKIINSVCFGCGKVLERVTKSKAKRCSECDIVNHGDYTIYASDMSAAVRPNERDCKFASSIPVGVLPSGYVISKVLVPPIHLRTPEDMEWSTDIQKLYEQLAHAVRRRGDVCAAYCKITGAQRSEGVTGIMSGKSGVFRKLMMGKRVELSARAVVVGDPGVKLDEVAVPRAISDFVRVKTTCGSYNINIMKDLADQGRLWWEDTDDIVDSKNIVQGMVFQRGLINGDLVMLNRQPSLSRQSLTCFKVVLRRDNHNVFGINPQATQPFNADFDGDEMNTFFMSQSNPPVCRAEMAELCHMSPHQVPVQDVVTGCYIMSKKEVPVSVEVCSDCAVICNTNTHQQTTHGLLSMCIPEYDGKTLTKKTIFRPGLDIYTLQLVVERWLSTHGLTVSLNSVRSIVLPVGHDETSDEYRERCLKEVQKEMSGSGLMSMIESGAKGSTTHAVHMAVAIGQQYVGGNEGIFCTRSYTSGLTPDEFFGHQMAAREGVVSTGVSTANTGYLNRRACKVMADLKLQYNNTVADNVMISSFN